MKKYIVCLTDEEHHQVEDLVGKGQAPAYKISHAHILLKADADGPCWTDEAIAEAFCCHRGTVEGIRKRFVEQGGKAPWNARNEHSPPGSAFWTGKAKRA